MNLRACLYKAAQKIAINQDSAFRVPKEKQKKILEKLKEPQNLIERSYNQFLCQRWLKSNYINAITEVGSIILIIYYYIKKDDRILNQEHRKAVFIGMGLGTDIIPEELNEQYKGILNLEKPGERLTKKDRKIIRELMAHYPLSFEFVLKCLIKVRIYRWVISTYSPDAIIVSEEYSYTSSFLTYYCRENNVKHINIMHGEKLYYIRDSFFEFDKCYIWDSYYINLFKLLRASANQFVIAVPPSLILKGSYSKKYDYTYYLGGESKEKLVCILNLLLKLKSMGYKVAIRPHPRYSKKALIEDVFKEKLDIENTEKISIEESVLRTQNVVSLYSTVINQAINSGVKAVLDDVSDGEKYERLSELEYRFVMSKDVLRISELII